MEEKRTKMDGQRKLTPLETLKAYHDFKQFRKYMYVAIDKMPKWLKHSEGANCIVSIKTCVRCLSVISRTYVREIKLQYADIFLTEWDVISDSIAFFSEVKGISNHQRAVMYKMREGIEGQIASLRQWLLNNRAAAEQNQKEL